MKKLTISVAVSAGVSLCAGIAFAEDCSGVNARVSDPPVVVHKAEDGTVTMFLSSTGSSSVMAPLEKANTGWQNCNGLVVTKADKSSSGSGVCFRVAENGDVETVTWRFDGDDRTWKRESGTGSMAGAAHGTWEPSAPMGNGLGIGHWKGDCE